VANTAMLVIAVGAVRRSRLATASYQALTCLSIILRM
jgi:hypothetical protein